MQLEGRRVIVVGLGASGIAAAELCRRYGAAVLGTDSKQLVDLPAPVGQLGIELRLGGHQGVDWDRADLIVVSPGVPPMPALRAAETAGIEVISELELGWRFLRSPLVCVGGTNGKSTVTTLLAGMLQVGGNRVFSGGNLGTPLCQAVDGDYSVLVAEVSSFQLERVPTLRPKVAILLNISDDHLDRYDGFQDYADAKGNVFVNQRPGDVAVIPVGDAACERQARRGEGRCLTFGPGGDYAVEDSVVVEQGSGERFETAGAQLRGAHNVENAAAAIAAARVLQVESDAIRRALLEFQPLRHRMAYVAELRGVRFYDDSKATNVGAAVTALRGLREPRGVLIAGGRDKRGSYDSLVAAVEAKARAVVVLGEAADAIAAAVGQRAPVYHARSLDEAVKLAFAAAQVGDAVLLSPACASFDMFRSYADRGEQFQSAVRAMVAACRADSPSVGRP